jgi:hypothetical protein
VQHETCSFSQARPGCTGKLEKWQQHQHADRQMYQQRMESTKELEPVPVRAAIKPKDQWKDHKQGTQDQNPMPLR